jgi:SAM-dependent methyltransferase
MFMNNTSELDRGNFLNNVLFVKNSGYLHKDSRVLELGSGNGRLVASLRQEGFNIVGSEINHSYRETAMREFSISLENFGGESIPYQDAAFDIVLSFDVFEHIPDIDKHLSEVKRILVHGGVYLLQTPNKITNIPFEVWKHKSFSKYKEYHCSLHTYSQLRNRFMKHGFHPTFVNMPVKNAYFMKKIERNFGIVGQRLATVFNPDHLPSRLRTNFYVIAQA